MVGDRYKLFGTDNVFEITSDQGTHWEIAVKSDEGQIDDVLIGKQALIDSVRAGSLTQI